MKTRVILTLCLALVLGLASNANAQLIAGSAEDKAFEKILAENNADAKQALLIDYEKQFPQSRVLADILTMQMETYRQKNDTPKVTEIGEKIIKIDPNNVNALLAVSRNYSLERKNLEQAAQYAQKALDVLATMKSQPAPANYSAEQWKAYVDGNEQSAKGLLAYANSLKR
jgi:tetratricopeptide (TPR) repeat protein